MSDEEKNVIDLLKNIDKQKCVMLECPVVKNNIERQLKIIELNRIIRKQSKEIEELKEKIKTFKIEDENIYLQFGEIIEKKRWEDKIKAKIKELEKGNKNTFIRGEKILVLQSLLEKE